MIILPPSTQEEINSILANVKQGNVTLIVGSTVIADNAPLADAIDIVEELTDEKIQETKIVNLDVLNKTLTEKSDAQIKPIISKDNVEVAEFLDTNKIKTKAPVVLSKPLSFVPTIVGNISEIDTQIADKIADKLDQLRQRATTTTSSATTTTMRPAAGAPVYLLPASFSPEELNKIIEDIPDEQFTIMLGPVVFAESATKDNIPEITAEILQDAALQSGTSKDILEALQATDIDISQSTIVPIISVSNPLLADYFNAGIISLFQEFA